MILDNINRASEEQLADMQIYAKDTTNERVAKAVFATSESHVPRHMMGELILCVIKSSRTN